MWHWGHYLLKCINSFGGNSGGNEEIDQRIEHLFRRYMSEEALWITKCMNKKASWR